MNTHSLHFIALAAVLTFTTAPAKAQQPGREQKEAQQQGGMMSMDNMMQECRKHCQRTRGSIANLQKTLEEARQSNDPAKMRNAIEQAEKPLADMQNHMDMCMNMMNMMGMHGMGRGMMQGSAGEQKKGEKRP